jgi:RNA polymerase sigma factor (sigma-70 family)
MIFRPTYFKRLLKFLRRKGRSHEDAEDLIQEAMLRLHLYGQEVPVVNEEAFLRHAVNNLSIDQHRRDRLDLRKEVPIEELDARSPLIAPESTPEEMLEAQQRLCHIRAVLDAVSVRTREIWTGRIFHHYIAIPVDGDLFLDDLVIWLHRPPESALCWTADSAYLIAKSWSWITTERVLAAMSPGGAGRSAYCRRKMQPLAPDFIAIVTGRTARRPKQRVDDVSAGNTSLHRNSPERPTIEEIAQFIADSSHISYEDMRSDSRRRAVSRAKVVATVLSTRNGASVAAVSRLFGCSRSTLIEMAERYRESQPQLFADSERALEAYLERKPGPRDYRSARLPQNHVNRQCA